MGDGRASPACTSAADEVLALRAEIRGLRAAMEHRAPIEQAKGAVREVDNSKQEQLDKARADIAALHARLIGAQEQESRFEQMLREVQTACEQQTRLAEQAKKEAQELSDLLDKQRAAETQRQAAVERREQEVLTLMEEMESKNGGAVSTGDASSLLAQREISHAAIAVFWNNFVAAHPQPATPGGPSAAQAFSQPAHHESVMPQEEPVESGVADPLDRPQDLQASAMREALAAAKAELADAKRQSSAPTESKEKAAPVKKRKQAAEPFKVTKETLKNKSDAKAATPPVPPPGHSFSVDLDADVANQLRTLRRLNPNKSDAELLTAIQAAGAKKGRPGTKKSWIVRSCPMKYGSLGILNVIL